MQIQANFFEVDTPPDLTDHLRLIRSRRVGPATYHRLIAEHGTASAALDALPKIASDAGVKSYEACPADVAEHEIEAGTRLGARLLLLGTQEYPTHLAEIEDAPPLLWCLGDPEHAQRPAIAMVGARNASSLGLRMARKLAVELGEAGYVIVSGMARGIDTACHKAAIETGTIAVLAGGVDNIYPRENAELAAKIAANGLRLSEMPIGLSPQARHFPRRNRIISGLAQAVIVVEGAAKSGSLITARDALDQGREVMAIPGHPFDARASGCNILIRDGATLVRGADDVIEALSGMKTQSEPKIHVTPAQDTPRSVNNVAAAILALLGPSPVSEDVVIRETGAATSKILQSLTELELEGRIDRLPGGMVALAFVP